MALYLVTYDVSNEDRRTALREAIEVFRCAEVCESSYAIKTSRDASEIRDGLKEHIKTGDKLFVCGINGWASSHLSTDAVSFLQD